MNRFGLNGFAAFQPPSDMTGGGAGGGRKKLWIGLGIGCGVVLLVIGILFAAGAFQAVTCCSEVKNLAESSVVVRDFGQSFADAVHAGNVDAAYEKTSPEFQAGMTPEQFAQAVEAHREAMQANAPRLFDMQLQSKNSQSIKDISKGKWRLSYQFAKPSDEKMLLLSFLVVAVGEGADQKFVIDDVRFDESLRDLEREPPAQEVLEIHEMLQRGNSQMAYVRLAPGFQEETDHEAFQQFLRDTGDVLTHSKLEIREVAYNDSNTQATVMAHARTLGGKDAIVQFELVPLQSEMPGFGWRVVSIAPIVAESKATEVDAGSESTDAGPKRGKGSEGAKTKP